MVWYIILILAVLCVGFVIRNLLLKLEKNEEKNEEYSDIISEYNKFWVGLKNAVDVADLRLRQIDEKETFKSDDEIGWFFENIKGIQNTLNVFFVEQIKKTPENTKK